MLWLLYSRLDGYGGCAVLRRDVFGVFVAKDV